MSSNLSILIIDDDKGVLLTIETLIKINFPNIKTHTEKNGEKGWKYIQKYHPQIVISDLSMPIMDGMQLCIKVRANHNYNDIIFLVLTADSDINKRIELLDKGANDFCTKPVNSVELKARLKSAIRFAELQLMLKEENQLLHDLASELERDIQDMTKLAVKFIQARIPASYEMLKLTSRAAVWIAELFEDLEEEDIRDIELASFLSQVGRIFLPDNLLKKPVMIDGIPTDELMYQVPVSAKEIVSSMRRFSDAADLIHHIYENFDGSGIPDRKQSWQIPIGSRIIRVALDYFEARFFSNTPPLEILRNLHREEGRLYDPRMVTLLDQWVRSNEDEVIDPNEIAVQLSELQQGMKTTRAIITNSGLKLVPVGAVLNEKTIRLIIKHNTSDPILGNIHVKRQYDD